MAIRHLRVLLTLGIVLAASPAFARVLILTDSPNDDEKVRGTVWSSSEVQEAARQVTLIERFALADRTKPYRDAMEPPEPCFRHLTRDQLEKTFGKPVDRKSVEYARPVGGQFSINLITTPPNDVNLNTKSFYEIKDVGGVIVYFSKSGVAVSPSILYLRLDPKFIALRREQDLTSRLEWEAPKLKKLKELLRITEEMKQGADGEWYVVPGHARSSEDNREMR